MAKCSGITRAGTACKGIPIDGSQWCYVHHPDHTEERKRHGRRGGQRGGRGRPAVEVADLKEQLEDLYSGVLTGMTEPKVGAVANQIINTRARLIETGLKVREQMDLEERLEALEGLFAERQDQRKGRTWGG